MLLQIAQTSLKDALKNIQRVIFAEVCTQEYIF